MAASIRRVGQREIKYVLVLLTFTVFLSACGGGASTGDETQALVDSSVPTASATIAAPGPDDEMVQATPPAAIVSGQPTVQDTNSTVAPTNSTAGAGLQTANDATSNRPQQPAVDEVVQATSGGNADTTPAQSAASSDGGQQPVKNGNTSNTTAVGNTTLPAQGGSVNSIDTQPITTETRPSAPAAEATDAPPAGNVIPQTGPFATLEQPDSSNSAEQIDTPEISVENTPSDAAGQAATGDQSVSDQTTDSPVTGTDEAAIDAAPPLGEQLDGNGTIPVSDPAADTPQPPVGSDNVPATDPVAPVVDMAVTPVAEPDEPVTDPVTVPAADAGVPVGDAPAVPIDVNETFSEYEEEDGVEPVRRSGCVGNLAWLDANADGVRRSNEKGLAISLIELISPAGDVVDATATNSGYYQLCAAPGNYTIRFAIPANHRVSVKDAGASDTADSDANESGLIDTIVVANKNKTKYDIGLVFVGENAETPTPEDIVQPSDELQASEQEQLPSPASPVVMPDTPAEVVVSNPVNNAPSDGNGVSRVRWGFWTETRNAFQSPLGPVDEGVETTFEKYTFAHVKALSSSRLDGDTQDKQYVINVLNKARATNTVLDLKLGSAAEYGWNFTTERGNFNLGKWKNSLSNFSASADPAAHDAIMEALGDGTIRYIFLIDEPNHKRWSPQWDGSHGTDAPGNPNHVSNADLDAMAAHVKAIFGQDTKTIVRTSAVNLITGNRGGMYVFEHLTHAYLTISSRKWTEGKKKGPNKGLEWWLSIKNNFTDNTTNFTAFAAANLKPSIMIQAGFESSGNPWTGQRDFKSRWWGGNIRYPFRGASGYVKTAPFEMDFWIKSLLSPRDPTTGALSDTGIRWFDEFVIFRADRLPTDSGRLPFSTYPHYNSFLDRLKIDLENNDLNPVIGIPVGWTGD